MKKVVRLTLALAGMFVIPTITRAQFAGSVVAYTEGSGVSSGYNDPNCRARRAITELTPGVWQNTG